MKFFYSLFLFFNTLLVFSQYYITGQDKASQKWYHLQTEYFHIIFPETYKPYAREFAYTSEKNYRAITKSIHWSNKKIPVILHTNSIVPNAFSLWTPERTEFYMTPGQNSYGQAWYKQLIVHEYRHMLQMDKLNQGLTKVLTYVIGQHATAVVMGLFMPMWYMEGDAVTTETAFSQAGRGRLPSFEARMKAHLLEKPFFSFDKMTLGSYKDYIPDQYYFGYYFVAQSRKFYGDSLWSNAINTSARKWFLISPLNYSFVKQTGLTKKKLYKKYFTNLKEEWEKNMREANIIYYKPLPLQKKLKAYTHYKFPIWLNDSTLLAEKNGMEDYSKLVTINTKTGKEKVIHRLGFFSPESRPSSDIIPLLSLNISQHSSKNSPGAWTLDNLSRGNRFLCWAEKKWHPRWEHESYSIIKLMDIENGKIKQLTHRSKYFAPSLSSDDSLIVAVEFTPDQHCSIVVLDRISGKVRKHFPLPAYHFAMLPVFSPDKKYIACITQRPDIKQIEVLNLETGAWKVLLSAPKEDIYYLYWNKDKLYFTATFSGIDNLYAYDFTDSTVYQLTQHPYGAYHPHIMNNMLAFDGYTANGHRLYVVPLDSLKPIPLKNIKKTSIYLENHYLEQESIHFKDTVVSMDTAWPLKRYRKFPHLLHVHSWLPFFVDQNSMKILPGFSFMSQDLLSTSFLTGGVGLYPKNYDISSKNHLHANLDYTYAGFFPLLEVKYKFFKQDNEKENKMEVLATLPLHTTWQRFSQSFSVSMGYQYLSLDETSINFHKISHHATLQIRFSNHEKMSIRQFAPHWRQDFSILLWQNLNNKKDLDQFIHLKLFFPSAFKLHSIQTQFNYLNNPSRFLFLQDNFSLSRGYWNVFPKKGYTFQTNYYFPIFYPDLPIGSVVYLKRLRLGLFYDYSNVDMYKNTTSVFQNEYVSSFPYTIEHKFYRSTGFEFTWDVHFLRFFLPIECKYQLSYLIDQSRFSHQIALGLNFMGW